MNEINVYNFEIENKYMEKEEIFRRMENIYSLFKRTIDANLKYANISFIIGISETDSHDSKVTYVYTGRSGRPKRKIIGTKIAWHFHIYVFSFNGSPSTFCNEMIHRLSKKGYKIRAYKRNNSNNTVSYIDKQCSNTRRYGRYFT